MPESALIDERKAWSEEKINEFRQAVLALPDVTMHNDLCIYVTGSFGRLEASQYSDLDLFFVKENGSKEVRMSRIDEILMDAALISTCRTMGFPEFSGDGEYLQVHYLQDMRDRLGGRYDDYENLFTARLLLLLESLPIYNEALYGNVLREITESYFRDYEAHERDFQPTFLTNDILRFWKTLCLNYENSRNNATGDETEVRKSQLRNIKLKFSRMLTCFSLVIPLAVPRQSISIDDCVQLMQERPLERLRKVASDHDQGELWDALAEEYGWFLDKTGRGRTDVLHWIGSVADRQEAHERAGRFGDNMYQLLSSVADPATMKVLVI